MGHGHGVRRLRLHLVVGRRASRLPKGDHRCIAAAVSLVPSLLLRREVRPPASPTPPTRDLPGPAGSSFVARAGGEAKLSEYIGKKYVILFFYPLDSHSSAQPRSLLTATDMKSSSL
ncbi:hypothetical protein GUJ93_ZPchr0004g39943 [Zizania palustris]|uniref:Alkyl hydroperoxide reductase subunit C/ Thiol specific antioxidant domain-containing protein n=1 Tax=Zizania palustris TaxID=103762 RepID=A0A8J5VYH1_ZIZPA|nr:hypothetical protein GUJ93_ZPchr0004g39943 [Zizania palustris]